MDKLCEEALALHYEMKGKIETQSKRSIVTKRDLALLYTPGAAQPCLEIAADEEKSFELTGRGKAVAVITDGSAVLGLGDIGAAAALPVMEGKCALFRELGGINAVPLCIGTKDVDKFIETVFLLSKSFGGINLEDISAPRCFEAERRLKELCDIPVFHDDQHGTAIAVAAALLNAIKVSGKKFGELRIVINGAGAAGTAVGGLLSKTGFGNVIMCDINGILRSDDRELSPEQKEILSLCNIDEESGTLGDALKGADVFVGLSRPGLVSSDMVSSMRKGIVFAMANPVPEIMPEAAKSGGAVVTGTGRSDFPNQINNVSVFPGLFKGALRVRAREISEGMKIAAARALAALVPEDRLSAEYILPSPLDRAAADAVADAVSEEAVRSGIARTAGG